MNQTTSGIYPAQTDDLKRQILAALADPECNGEIFLVGGSSGGCLALYDMLDSTTGDVSNWTEAARTSIKAVVSLSGPAALCDWYNPGNIDILEFENSVDGYTGVSKGPPPVQDCSKLKPASPATIAGYANSSPPVMLYATDGDPVPYVQSTDMKTALSSKFPALEVNQYTMSYTANGTDHAFEYWHEINTVTSKCVSSEVIAFLNKYK